MKAVVLAAGEAKRLRPLTAARPKGMLPVADRPLLEHVVDALANTDAGTDTDTDTGADTDTDTGADTDTDTGADTDTGTDADLDVDEIILVVGYRRERIQSHFEGGSDWGVDIRYVEQSAPRGTGDALLQAEPFVDDAFLVVNGDRIVSASAFEATAARLASPGVDATMAVTTDENPSDHGVVTLDGDRIVGIEEKPPPHALDSDVVNVGVYGFTPAVFGMLRGSDQRGELALTEALAEYLADHRFEAVRYDGIWPELDYLWEMLTANAAMLELTGTSIDPSARVADDASVHDPVVVDENAVVQPGARLLRDTVVCDSATIGVNAVLTNTVVLPNATIGTGTVLTDCIVGEGTRIGANVTAGGGRTDVVADGELHTDVKLGGVIGDNATVGDATTILPGSVLGNRTTVASGATVADEYPDDARIER